MRTTSILAALALASVPANRVLAQPSPERATARLIVFSEPGFPLVDVDHVPDIPGAIVAESATALADAFAGGGVLVWRHGSAFPAESWEPFLRFLERGGSLLYLGGEPFTRVAVGTPGSRVVQPRTSSLLKVLRLNQSYRMDASGATVVAASTGGFDLPQRQAGERAWVSVLEPRFADTKDFADEDGSPGARDAVLHPILHLKRSGDDPRFPFAAGAYAIDRLLGRFAGGRWVFWLLSEAPSERERDVLLQQASAAAIDFRVDPMFGTFHDGEQPSVILRVHRPLAADRMSWQVHLTVDGPSGVQRAADAALTAGAHGTVTVPLAGTWPPGLYRVNVQAAGLPPARTGFWIFDKALFTSGDRLTFDTYTLRRNGRPEPVVGTTMMSATVHRDFLFEPDAATWDDTFAELASIKINMVRTGTWSAWKKISLDSNVVDEAFLRALEAYYLTARRHGIPVIFNFFAFLPETFGGENPFLDPRSVEGQRAYVSAIASRFAGAKEILWDFINEPSFSSAQRLWSTRPNRDPHERGAFLTWLEARYSSSAHPGETWQDVVRRRWRLLPEEPIDLPLDADFDDRHLMGGLRPYRALDYMLFAQEAFGAWTQRMTEAVREGGSQAPVTVGQDEGGLTTRPSPLFHHSRLSFTSMHTWWNNDALLWDGVLAKATRTPLLISETGIMQRELLSGDAVRDADSFARLLSRKIGYAFAAGAFGVIQWCYDVNPYMASDNEVAIGLRRVDGSYKPEHRVLREVAAFVGAHRDQFDGYIEPDVVLLIPFAEIFSARDAATSATRVAVRTLFERLMVPARAVSEYLAASELGDAKAIVLPATRGLSTEGWNAVTAAVRSGARLIADGWFETDDAGLPAERLAPEKPRRPLAAVEDAIFDGREPAVALRFPGALPESWFAATGNGPGTVTKAGNGAIHHHPLPLEWADSGEGVERHYRSALTGLLSHAPITVAGPLPEGCTVRVIPFRESILVVGINESSSRRSLRLAHQSRPIDLTLAAGTAAMVLVNRKTGAVARLQSAEAP